jgi:hypothetical protein
VGTSFTELLKTEPILSENLDTVPQPPSYAENIEEPTDQLNHNPLKKYHLHHQANQ